MIKWKLVFTLSLTTMVFLSNHSRGASHEESLRLDAAYPVGSKILCQSDLKDGVYENFPMKLVMRGTVTAIQGDLTQYDISVDWIQRELIAHRLPFVITWLTLVKTMAFGCVLILKA